MSNLDNMNRIFILTLGCAALAITITQGAAQSSSPGTTRTAIFAGGCFWCIQPAFDKGNGVIQTVVGYSSGEDFLRPTAGHLLAPD